MHVYVMPCAVDDDPYRGDSEDGDMIGWIEERIAQSVREQEGLWHAADDHEYEGRCDLADALLDIMFALEKECEELAERRRDLEWGEW